MYENKEQVLEKMREIASLMEQKVQKADELRQSAIMDSGRIEELKNLYNMFVAKEQELLDKEEEEPAPKKAPAKKGAKK